MHRLASRASRPPADQASLDRHRDRLIAVPPAHSRYAPPATVQAAVSRAHQLPTVPSLTRVRGSLEVFLAQRAERGEPMADLSQRLAGADVAGSLLLAASTSPGLEERAPCFINGPMLEPPHAGRSRHRRWDGKPSASSRKNSYANSSVICAALSQRRSLASARRDWQFANDDERTAERSHCAHADAERASGPLDRVGPAVGNIAAG
jgi:hypothetical protein